MQNTAELYKIIVSLVAVVIGSWGMFGFFVIRWIKSSDDNFKELFSRTRIPISDLSIRIEKMNDRVYENETILREKSIVLDTLVQEHCRIHKNG